MPRGSIRKRAGRPKPYECVIDLGPDPATGQRRQRTLSYRTRREAQTALTRWLAELDAGSIVDRSTRTTGELLTEWLETEARPRIRAKTYEGYEFTVRVHLLPHLGAIPLQKLSAAHLQRFFAERRAEGRGAKTIRNCYQRLRQALDYAVRLGYVRANVTAKVTPPPLRHPPRTTWTAEQAQRYLEHATASSYGPVWVLALATGLRLGELLGLRWADVDLDMQGAHPRLTVRQTASALNPASGGYRIELGEPKTPSARRTITLPRHAAAALREHRRRQNERRLQRGADWIDLDLVFCTGVGAPVQPQALRDDHRRWLTRAGLPRITIHDLRHTFATLALEAGMRTEAVSEMLGHSSPAITLSIYAHVTRAHHERIADAMDDLLFHNT